MRFVCDSCRAQYMISDAQVGATGVKVRCKRCGSTLSLQRPEAAAETHPGKTERGSLPLASTEARGGREGAFFEGATEDEIGAVFDQVLSAGPHGMPVEAGGRAAEGAPEGGEPLDGTGALNAATKRREGGLAREEVAPGEEASPEWYVAINDEQVGPLDWEKVREHWERGAIGPDSLCWRAGMADWLPLADVPELQRHLAPRPAKPLILTSTPPAPAASGAGPVELAFIAGGTGKPVSAVPAEDAGGWKPSAASTLASLVKEEMDALSRPPAPKASEPVQAASLVPGLLDVPVLQSPPPAGALASPPATPVLAQVLGRATAPAQPGDAPTPAFPQQPGDVPSPSAAPLSSLVRLKVGRGLRVLGGGALLVALVALAVVLLLKPGEESAPPALAVASEKAPAPRSAVAPSAGPVLEHASARPPALQPAGEGAPEGAGVAAVQPVSGQGAAPAVAPAHQTPPAGAVAPLQSATPPEARMAPAPERSPEKPVRRERRAERAVRETPRREEPRPQQAMREESASEDPFEDIFGTPKVKPKQAEPKQQRAETYIPPPPGRSDVPETLGQADIMQVVLANKSAIVRCVQQQKASSPGLSGKLFMRWTVQTTGRVTGVSCQSPEFKDTQMAACIAGLIETWTFPRHQKQGAPINFPFTF